MSVSVNGEGMINAAVNTDPLPFAMSNDQKKIHYGLKERQVSHIKINDTKELGVWYEIGPKIGEGGFATVTEVTEKCTNKKWALKSVSKSSEDRIRLVQQELEVLKLIQHPHIIYLDKVFESSRYMYMIFELCIRDFYEVYTEKKPFTEKIARTIIRQLVDAVAYLHKYDIVHRDLKMENMLLGSNPDDPEDEYYIKLTDFGLSITKFGKGLSGTLHDFCGTLHYMAPEIITKRSYTQMCDMWSVGVILYMLVMGTYPFHMKNEQDMKTAICNDEPDMKNKAITNELKDLISNLLMKDPVKRLRATEVLQHPWINNKKMSKSIDYNIMDKMKEWKSELRVQDGHDSRDWVAISQDLLELNRSYSNKQPLVLPKTNIKFDRNQKRGTPNNGSPPESGRKCQERRGSNKPK